mmetsp:Transcript_100554/g.189614  ORF Transcript_100554/g.189614 Transcript_100554/m.189614 type:complete len:209 (+) Transcript_100554:644-1270(+)
MTRDLRGNCEAVWTAKGTCCYATCLVKRRARIPITMNGHDTLGIQWQVWLNAPRVGLIISQIAIGWRIFLGWCYHSVGSPDSSAAVILVNIFPLTVYCSEVKGLALMPPATVLCNRYHAVGVHEVWAGEVDLTDRKHVHHHSHFIVRHPPCHPYGALARRRWQHMHHPCLVLITDINVFAATLSAATSTIEAMLLGELAHQSHCFPCG